MKPTSDTNALIAADPSTIAACGGNPECFAFTIDTRMTNTLDTDPTHYSGTATTFAIPTSGYVNASSSRSYNWIINWGDGSAEQTVSGTSGTTGANANGIPHDYASTGGAGEYQITIRPSAAPSEGWFNAFGFYTGTAGANASANKLMFKSIDTPFTELMRTKWVIYRFALMFNGARNGTEIPSNLFVNISTASDTVFTGMFYTTFASYAYNSTTATIPAGLFSTIDTSSGTRVEQMFYDTFNSYAYNSTVGTIPTGLFNSIDTTGCANFSRMFSGTFSNYAYNSTVGNIPAGLFDSIDTSSGTNFANMFSYTFNNYARNSSVGTIPTGLLDSINTGSGTDFSNMFSGTFASYAYNSTTATIPSGLFNSINTSLGKNFEYTFQSTFYSYAYNSTVGTIPTGLFDSIDTSSGTNFSNMFYITFSAYAYRSTIGTIPAGLLDSINTGSGTDFGSMFGSTFASYAYSSTVATIPTGLFDSIDTSSGTSFGSMFSGTFRNYAYSSTVATIPSGLFDSINTSKCTSFNNMFSNTFYSYAYSSTVGTIPAGLFSYLDTSIGTNFYYMFQGTFDSYAYNSTVGTAPAGLFSSINTSGGTSFTNMFSGTFNNYARRTATFMVGPTVVTTRTFAGPYSAKISPTGTPSANPTVNATTGSQVIPTYNATGLNITAPTGAYAGLIWYRTDGTSCAVPVPTPDCGAQTPGSWATFPNNTEWIPTTSTEKGNVTFYSGPATAAISNITVNGWTSVTLAPKTATITLTTTVRTSIPAGTDISSWFNTPPGITVTTSSPVAVGATAIPITFSGTPTADDTDTMTATIPAAYVTSGFDLTAIDNPDAKWNIVTADAAIYDVTVTGWPDVALIPQTSRITLTNTAVSDGITFRTLPIGTDITSWFTNIPDGLTVTVAGAIARSTIEVVPIEFSGTPTMTSTDVMTVTIPAAALTSGADLVVADNPDAKWNITIATADISDVTVTGTVGQALTPQDATITLDNTATAHAIPAGTDISSWFTNLPPGVIVTVSENIPAGATDIPITFSGTPTETSTNPMTITIPASYLISGADLTINSNVNARWEVGEKRLVEPPELIPGPPNSGCAGLPSTIFSPRYVVK
ncbi:hypothetical protein FWD20_01790 [Candidatus Saccharibacteria bacterium]|nr:hypothetical protein [Candidatus Saccharibacteria bacterium]